MHAAGSLNAAQISDAMGLATIKNRCVSGEG
jgi:hypothetical protein